MLYENLHLLFYVIVYGVYPAFGFVVVDGLTKRSRLELNYGRLGGTWGQHINSIISNDYGCGKGSSVHGSGNAPAPQQQHASQLHQPQHGPPHPQSSPVPVSIAPQQIQGGPGAQPTNLKDDRQTYISWKLRHALRPEKEQQQQQPSPQSQSQQPQQLNHQNHPDERNIIRVAQPESRSSQSAIPSSKDSNHTM